MAATIKVHCKAPFTSSRTWIHVVVFLEQPPLLIRQGSMTWHTLPFPWYPSAQVHWYLVSSTVLQTAYWEHGEELQGSWAEKKVNKNIQSYNNAKSTFNGNRFCIWRIKPLPIRVINYILRAVSNSPTLTMWFSRTPKDYSAQTLKQSL